MNWHRMVFSPAGLIGAPSNAVERVGRIAHGLGAEIDLFDCLYDPEIAALAPDARLRAAIRERVEQRRREVQRLADALRERALTVHVSVHWDYPAYEALVRHVRRSKADLLAVPASRASRAEQGYLSYTDHRLIEVCPCPLLLLKKRGLYGDGAVLAAVAPHRAEQPATPLDEIILGAAATLAHALGDAAVHVCHVVAPAPEAAAAPPVAADAAADAAGGAAAAAPERSRLADARQRVEALAALHGVPASRVHIESGSVAQLLPQIARALPAELLAMGAVSRSLPDRPYVTATAESVLDALDCDFLVLKPRTFRSPVSLRPRSRARRERRTPVASAQRSVTP